MKILQRISQLRTEENCSFGEKGCQEERLNRYSITLEYTDTHIPR